MKKFLSALCLSAALAVAGCASVSPSGTPAVPPAPKSPQEIAATIFRTTCVSVPLADLGFQVAAIAVPSVIDANAVKWEGLVYARLSARCAGPVPDITSVNAVVAEIAADVKSVMDVVAVAKANAPATP